MKVFVTISALYVIIEHSIIINRKFLNNFYDSHMSLVIELLNSFLKATSLHMATKVFFSLSL